MDIDARGIAETSSSSGARSRQTTAGTSSSGGLSSIQQHERDARQDLLLDESAHFIGGTGDEDAGMSYVDERGQAPARTLTTTTMTNGSSSTVPLHSGDAQEPPESRGVSTRADAEQQDEQRQQQQAGSTGAEQQLTGGLQELQLTDAEKEEARKQRRGEALMRERDDLARMNMLLEQATASLERAIPRVGRFENTVATAHELLDTYARLMSQTQHTQKLLLDGRWEAARDEEEIQAEADALERERREEEERRARELREREEQERREREEAERRAYLAANPPARGRGTGTRGVRGTRGRIATSSASGIGRGTGSTVRGRGIARGSVVR